MIVGYSRFVLVNNEPYKTHTIFMRDDDKDNIIKKLFFTPINEQQVKKQQ